MESQLSCLKNVAYGYLTTMLPPGIRRVEVATPIWLQRSAVGVGNLRCLRAPLIMFPEHTLLRLRGAGRFSPKHMMGFLFIGSTQLPTRTIRGEDT